jgi:hypothetical protein
MQNKFPKGNKEGKYYQNKFPAKVFSIEVDRVPACNLMQRVVSASEDADKNYFWKYPKFLSGPSDK